MVGDQVLMRKSASWTAMSVVVARGININAYFNTIGSCVLDILVEIGIYCSLGTGSQHNK